MRATRFVLPALFVLTSFTAPLWAGEAEPAPAVQPPAPPAAAKEVNKDGWPIAPMLPAETLFVFTVSDSSKAMAKVKELGLYNIYNNVDVQRAFRSQLLTARFALGMAELNYGLKVEEILSYFSRGEVTVAWIDTRKRNEQNQPIPDILIGIQAKDKAQALLDELNRTLDKFAAQANLRLIRENIPAGEFSVTRISLPFIGAADTYLTTALVDGNVLVSLGDGRIERLLAMREKYKAQPVKNADGAQPEVLGQLSSFQKLQEKAGKADLSLFLDVETLLKNQILNVAPKNEKEQRDWEVAGLRGIRALSYSASLSGKGVKETFFIDTPKETRKGLLALVDGDGLKNDALNAVPRSALIAGAVQLTPDKLLERVLDIAAVENPQAREDVNGWFLAIGQQLNLDVRRELFNAMSGQGVFSLSFTPKHPKLPVAFPQALLTLGVKDVAALKNMLTSLKNVAKENLEFTEMTFGQHEIVTAREKNAQGRDPGQFSYVIDGGDMIVALYPLALREELGRRARVNTGNPEKLSLIDDPDFVQARSGMTANPHGMLYVDSGALMTAAYDLLMPIVQLRERRPEVDVLALPPGDVIAQNFGGSVFGFKSDADGIVAEGYSPAGAIAFFGAVPAVIQRIQQRQAQAAANGEAPARPFGRRGGNNDELPAQVQEQREEMAKDLHKALTNYAQDNGGKFPEKLKILEGKYFLNGNVNLDDAVFRGKQDAPNKIVAHTPEKNPGPITILTQDGTVATISRRALGRALNQGYTPDAGAPKNNNEAVKPPRPPEF